MSSKGAKAYDSNMSDMEGQVCQSCGMPMSKDPAGGGTEINGSKTQEYCSHCYQNGGFTMPDRTAEGMVERVRARLTELSLPASVVENAASMIPTLHRWSPHPTDSSSPPE